MLAPLKGSIASWETNTAGSEWDDQDPEPEERIDCLRPSLRLNSAPSKAGDLFAMTSCFGFDRSTELALQLKCSPSLLTRSTLSSAGATLKQKTVSTCKDGSNPREAQSGLPLSLLRAVDLRDRFNRKRVPNEQLLTTLNSLIISLGSSDDLEAGHHEEIAEIQSILLVQIVLRSYSTLFETLCRQAFWLNDQILYWSTIENDRISTAYYLIQSLPLRLAGLTRQIWAHTRRALDQLGANEEYGRNRLSTWTRHLYNQAWARPHQEISISSLFPILRKNTRLFNSPAHSIQFLSTLSPILLTRQEARVKRQELELVHADLAEKIGCLVNGLHRLEDHAQPQAEESDVGLSGLVSTMLQVTSEPEAQAEQAVGHNNPVMMIDQLHQLLSSHLPNQQKKLYIRTSTHSPPGFSPATGLGWSLFQSHPIPSQLLPIATEVRYWMDSEMHRKLSKVLYLGG